MTKSIIEKLGINAPWRVVADPSGVYSEIKDKSGKYIDSHTRQLTFSEVERNMRLASMAPEMLEALITDILEAEKSWVENWDSDDSDEKTIIKKCQIANAAKIAIIEKATGESWPDILSAIGEGPF